MPWEDAVNVPSFKQITVWVGKDMLISPSPSRKKSGTKSLKTGTFGLCCACANISTVMECRHNDIIMKELIDAQWLNTAKVAKPGVPCQGYTPTEDC